MLSRLMTTLRGPVADCVEGVEARSVTIAPRRFHLRAPTMCTPAARKALALRTTAPMLASCCQFSTATWNGCPAGPTAGRSRPET